MNEFHLPHFSQRTPGQMIFFNDADRIERALEADKHVIWGFVIYRCTYASDSDWLEFVSRLQYHFNDRLQRCNGLDMLPSFRLTIFEDKNSLDGASKDSVRETFKEWAKTAPEREQDGAPATFDCQRYRYCVHVDEAALHSVVHDAPAPPAPGDWSDGFVNLVWAEWKPDDEESEDEDDDDVDEDTEEEAAAAVEMMQIGSDEEQDEDDEVELVHDEVVSNWEDVGWMKVDYRVVMLAFYNLLRGSGAWYKEYRPPPMIGHS